MIDLKEIKFSTQEKIQRDIIVSMKERKKDVSVLLRTVLGELNRVGKELTDEVVDPIIRKMYTNAVELDDKFEMEILEPYLLTRMTDEEVNVLVRQIVTMNSYTSLQDLGKVMKEFKEKSNKPVDGSSIASTARKWLLK